MPGGRLRGRRGWGRRRSRGEGRPGLCPGPARAEPWTVLDCHEGLTARHCLIRLLAGPGQSPGLALLWAERLDLIEPLGWLHGAAARDAVAAGLARPLAGGPAAFSLARLLPGGAVVPVAAVPPRWQPVLDRIRAPRAWAGLAGEPRRSWAVLNVTPDSFSDGGRHLDPTRAIAAGLAMAAAGADLVDVGGESTRPGARAVPPEEERARVLPVVRALAAQGVAVSVDTRNAATMAAALDAGARIVNDVSALAHDPGRGRAGGGARLPGGADAHARHSPTPWPGWPGTTTWPPRWRRNWPSGSPRPRRPGIARAAIALDPGIGFAKDEADNLDLLARLGVLLGLGFPLVVGVSRKRFIGRTRRRGRAAAPACRARWRPGWRRACAGAAVLRVHDVAETVQAVRVWRAILG